MSFSMLRDVWGDLSLTSKQSLPRAPATKPSPLREDHRVSVREAPKQVDLRRRAQGCARRTRRRRARLGNDISWGWIGGIAGMVLLLVMLIQINSNLCRLTRLVEMATLRR